jgi:hypothetical protein
MRAVKDSKPRTAQVGLDPGPRLDQLAPHTVLAMLALVALTIVVSPTSRPRRGSHDVISGEVAYPHRRAGDTIAALRMRGGRFAATLRRRPSHASA